MLVSLLVEQFDKNMCTSGTFKTQAWNYMVAEFNKTCSLNYDRHQLYNRWKTLKKLYLLYAQLMRKSGWGWDEMTHMPVPGYTGAWDDVLEVYCEN